MRKRLLGALSLITLLLFSSVSFFSYSVFAEEGSGDDANTSTSGGTSISLMPVSKILQISSASVYEDTMTVSNDGDNPMKIEVYAAPYSYVYSENEDAYKLGFNSDNNFTQIARWISFKDDSGNWVKKANFDIAPKSSAEINYRISTPDNIPGGGQYAVIFAHTLNGSVGASGIRTEASPGMVVYGRSSEGEVVVNPVISDLKIESETTKDTRQSFQATAKVKNDGNVDFNAVGVLKIQGLFGDTVYETPQSSGRISVIPEAELVVSDAWTDLPFFGIYRATWTVTVGESSETVEKVLFINFVWVLILSIILLTIVVIWSIIRVRRRKERRSRLAV